MAEMLIDVCEADAAEYLAGDLSAFVSGHHLLVSGGSLGATMVVVLAINRGLRDTQT